MAKPSTSIHKAEISQEELLAQSLTQLTTELAAHSSALIALLRFAEALESSGLLTTLTALLTAKDQVLGVALGQVTTPKVTNAIQNLLKLGDTLGNVNGQQVQSVLNALTAGLERGHQQLESSPEVSIFDLVRALRDPAVNRSMSLVLGALKGFGESVGI